MSKLLEDEKVAALVEKEVAKAVKTETKRVLDVVKTQLDANKETEDKAVKKIVDGVLKAVVADIKSPSSL